MYLLIKIILCAVPPFAWRLDSTDLLLERRAYFLRLLKELLATLSVETLV